MLIQEASSANLFNTGPGLVSAFYPDIQKNTAGSRTALIGVSGKILDGVDTVIEFTCANRFHTFQASVVPAGTTVWNSGTNDWSVGAFDFGVYGAGDANTKIQEGASTWTRSAVHIVDGSVVRMVRTSGLWEVFIDDVSKNSSNKYSLSGACDFYFGPITADSVFTDISIGGVGDAWNIFHATITETARSETVSGGSGGTPATWVGSETLASSDLTGGVFRFTPSALPSAAVRYEVYVDDGVSEKQYGSFDPATAYVDIPGISGVTTVRFDARGSDGTLTSNGPSVVVGGVASSTASTLTFNSAGLDRSSIGYQASKIDDFKDLATIQVDTTSAGFVAAVNAAAPGTHITVTDVSQVLTVGVITPISYQVLTPQGTVSQPITVSGTSHLSLRMDMRAEIRGTGHLIFEGVRITNCGGDHGPLSVFAPGVVLASSNLSGMYATPMHIQGDSSGAGHWCGLYNCNLDFAISNDFATPINIQHVPSASYANVDKPTIVGTFMAYCTVINQSASGVTASGWGGTSADPYYDTYLGDKDTFTRCFFCDFEGHTAGIETVSAKRDGFHIHGTYVGGGTSVHVLRYSHGSYVTGNVLNGNGGFRTVRVGGSDHVGRWNAFYNATAGRGVQLSVSDLDPVNGPAGNGTVTSHYLASVDNVWTDNVFTDTANYAALYGPISDEILKATGNTIKNVHLGVTSVPILIKERYTGGDVPDQDEALFETDNPNGKEADQILLTVTSGNDYARGSDFEWDETPQLRPNSWPVGEPDPLERFTEIHQASTHLRPSALFQSVVTTT